MEEMNTSISNINLVNFFEYMGETVLQHGNTTYKLADHDSLIISKSCPSTYYRFSTGKGGNAFTACKELYSLDKKQSMEKVKDFLKKINNKEFIPSTNFAKSSNSYRNTTFKVKEVDENKKHIDKYLVEKRGISQNLIDYFYNKKLISIDEHNNILFKIKDKDITKGYDIVGTTEKFYKRKTVPDLGFNISRNNNKANKLFVFESSIDLLSYMNLMDLDSKVASEFKEIVSSEENMRFIAMSGLKESTMNNYLENVKTICICTDNDLAGENFYKKIKENYKDFNVIRIRPKEKDFNDDLLVLRRGRGDDGAKKKWNSRNKEEITR